MTYKSLVLNHPTYKVTCLMENKQSLTSCPCDWRERRGWQGCRAAAAGEKRGAGPRARAAGGGDESERGDARARAHANAIVQSTLPATAAVPQLFSPCAAAAAACRTAHSLPHSLGPVLASAGQPLPVAVWPPVLFLHLRTHFSGCV